MTNKNNIMPAYFYAHLPVTDDKKKELEILTNVCNQCAIDILLNTVDKLKLTSNITKDEINLLNEILQQP